MTGRARLISIAAAFVIGLLVVEVLARVLVSAAEADEVVWYDASTQLRVEMLDRLSGVDMVFAGTSSAWQGLVPQVFVDEGAADSAFNVGLAGGVPPVTAPWLIDEVVPRVDPDMVVWGLTSLDFSPSYGDTNQESYEDAFATRKGWLAELDRQTSEVSELVRSRRLLRSPSKLWGREQDEIQDDLAEAAAVLGSDGERLDFAQDTGEERAAIMAARVLDYQLDTTDVDRVRDAVQTLLDQGREVVLVEVPLPDRFVVLHPNGAADIATASTAIDAIAAEFGLTVLRTTETFTDEDFVDFSHLTAEAATRFSADIADQLAA